MKNIWKYILAGLVVSIICLFWVAWFPAFFNGLTLETATVWGVGLFLSFEMVVLTGIIVSKIDKNKPSDTNK